MVKTAWLRRTVSYSAAAMMAVFGFTGVVSAQTITNTGPGSQNTISSTYTNNCTRTNNNNVSVRNSNNQSANSGNVNESGNTTAGVSWDGWGTFDPASAQANGTSYASWWSGVVNWVGQRASGNGWNSNQSNLAWMPSGSTWGSFDPVTWQANGQSFGNWYNAVESYLNSNSSAWVLSWPSDATGTGNFGAMSGSATNNYNANFSININNTARSAAGTNSCGQSNFTPPPVTGGMGGGGTWTAPAAVVMGSNAVAPHNSVGSGSGSGYYGGSSYYAPQTHSSAAPAVASTYTAPAAPSAPSSGGMGGGGSAPAAPVNSISNTGPGSSNTISSNYTNNSSVQNNNNVSANNYSTQSAASGNSNVSGNTSAGGGGSGDANNANGSGVGVGVTN